MLKQWLRQTYKQTRKWLSDRPNEQALAKEPLAYAWLNAVCERLVETSGGALRTNYTWGAIHGVHMAKSLGLQRVSLLEFGVAGGNGLVALEKAAEALEKEFGLAIEVYGFDTGKGLPQPIDYRDLPNLWSSGDYAMDEQKLRSRLKRAKLHLGLIHDTLPNFIASQPAPVAFISVDVDLYSSTVDLLKLLEADPEILLPRIHCYFDDLLGFTYGDFNGERLAIAEFNANHSQQKISPIYGLKHYVPWAYREESWVDAFFMAHILNHPLYNQPDGLTQVHTLDLK